MLSFDEGLDGLLLHIGQQMDHDLTAALHHPKDGRSFLLHGATATFAFEAASTAFSSLAIYHFRLPFMAGDHIRFIALYLV